MVAAKMSVGTEGGTIPMKTLIASMAKSVTSAVLRGPMRSITGPDAAFASELQRLRTSVIAATKNASPPSS